MVEAVDRSGQLIDVGADHVGRGIPVGDLQVVGEPGDGQHQILLRSCLRRQDRRGFFAVAGEDGLHTDDGVEDIGAGVALEGGEAVDVKDVVLGSLVGEVAVLEGRHGNLSGGVVHGVARDDLVLPHLFGDEVGDLGNQPFQPHDAALPGFEGLAVLAVHGAEADVLQLRLRTDDAALAGGPEDLLKVEALPLVHDVEDLVRVEELFPLHHGGEVGGGVEGRAVGLDEDAGRHFLLVRLLADRHDQRAVALHQQTPGLHVLQHRRNVGLSVALAVPDVKGDVQLAVVLLQVGHGDGHDVLPQGGVAGFAMLKLIGGVVGLFRKGLVDLGLGAGRGIDLLQLGDREGRLLRETAGLVRVEVGQVGAAFLQLRDDEAHLQAPVAHVDVADDVVAEVAVDSLDALADDGRAQMADVKGLGHIGAAVVDDNGAGLSLRLQAEAVASGHPIQVGGDIIRGQLQIQEAGLDGVHGGKGRAAAQLFGHGLGNLDRGPVGGLGGGHGAVALIFSEVGPVGDGHFAVGRVKTGRFKGGGDLGGDEVDEFLHSDCPFAFSHKCRLL